MSKSSKKEQEVDLEIKPKKSFSLRLTKQELLHLRDLFSVLLPSDLKSTVSQSLAASQGRHLVESKLWNKLISLCTEANIPMGDEAPDFVITITSPPDLGVFEMVNEAEDVPMQVRSLIEEQEAQEEEE